VSVSVVYSHPNIICKPFCSGAHSWTLYLVVIAVMTITYSAVASTEATEAAV